MRKKGFSLIELLVAISIIAILATIGLASYTSAQKRARDSKRKADLEQIRSALEMHRADENDYPTTAEGLAALVTASYIQVLPADPKASDYTYGYSSDGETYCLGALLEADETSTCGCSATPGCTEDDCSYCVENP